MHESYQQKEEVNMTMLNVVQFMFMCPKKINSEGVMLIFNFLRGKKELKIEILQLVFLTIYETNNWQHVYLHAKLVQ